MDKRWPVYQLAVWSSSQVLTNNNTWNCVRDGWRKKTCQKLCLLWQDVVIKLNLLPRRQMSLRDGQNCIITTGVLAISKQLSLSSHQQAIREFCLCVLSQICNCWNRFLILKFSLLLSQLLDKRMGHQCLHTKNCHYMSREFVYSCCLILGVLIFRFSDDSLQIYSKPWLVYFF